MAKSKKASRKEKKRLFIISLTILVLLCFLVGSVYKDWQQILGNRREEIELTKKYEELLDKEIKLSAEITKLHDDEYLARYAKEKYMLSSNDDIIIKSESK